MTTVNWEDFFSSSLFYWLLGHSFKEEKEKEEKGGRELKSEEGRKRTDQKNMLESLKMGLHEIKRLLHNKRNGL
jgi:hypothetical protein